MEHVTWEQIGHLFEEALRLPSEQRAAYLNSVCGDDASLLAELSSLLAAYDHAPEFMEDLAGSLPVPPPLPLPDAASASDDMIGTSVAHYVILEKLGDGGMGVVYRAEDTKLQRTVALKFLPPLMGREKRAMERFRREAIAASALDHPNICTIYEINETRDGRLFIAMGYYEGQTLRQRIGQGPLPLETALDVARQIGDALARAHRAGIVHRDIKPANVIITPEGRVILLDFGLAKLPDMNLTRPGTTMGTPTYMSPEQMNASEVDHRTDIWSFGVLLYEMLCGTPPFRGAYPAALQYMILNESPPSLVEMRADLPPALMHVIGLCLEKDPAHRYPSMVDVLADLDMLARGEDESLLRAAAPSTVSRTSPRRPYLIAGGLVGVLALVALLAPLQEHIGRLFSLNSLPPQKHLAILPEHPEGSPTARVFVDGVMASVEADLDQMADGEALWVIPASIRRQDSVATAAAAFRQYGINLALLVDAFRDATRAGITLKLVEPETGRLLRAASFSRPVEQLHTLEADLVDGLAEMLELPMTPGRRDRLARLRTVTPGAYEFYTQGRGYLERYREGDNLQAALTLFTQAARHDPNYALAQAGLCEAYGRQYEETEDVQWIQRAEQHCERAIELNDRLAPVYVTLGMLRTARGQYGSAIADYQNALARDSSYSPAYGGLARTYEALGRLEDAERAYQTAIARKPDYWAGYRDLGTFYFKQARYEDAITQFRHVVSLTPLNPRGFSNLGAMYFYLDRPDEAIEMFREALALREDHTVLSNLATLYYYEGRYAEAAETYERALRQEGNNYLTWGYLATAYAWSDQPEESHRAHARAVALAEKRLQFNPRDAEVLSHLASYYAYMDEEEKARSALSRLMALGPLTPEARSRVAETYERLGDRDQALAWLQQALEGGYSLVDIEDHPGFDALRADARYLEMTRPWRETDTP